MDPKLLVQSDSLLTERVRLALMATIAAAKEPVEFTALLETLELSKGNLATHLRKLEEAGLLTVSKEFVERKPRTTYRCTALGRKQLAEYLERVEQVLKGIGRD